MKNYDGQQTGSGLKHYSKLRFHSDYVYSTQNGKFLSSANSQVINTQTVTYSLGDSRVLNWRRRILSNGNNVMNHWIDDDTFMEPFKLNRDTITLVGSLYEDPLSSKNTNE